MDSVLFVKEETMSFIESIIYGIIQGLCEFLPISSSGHLAIAHAVMGTTESVDPLAYDILLHFGTLIAVFTVYFKDILLLIKAFFTLLGKLFRGKWKLSEFTSNERWVVFILIATVPLIPAALLDDKLEALSSYPIVVGVLLIVNAFILYFSEKIGKKTKGQEEMTAKNALIVGLVQMLAVVPGISRSGSTITGGLSQDLDRETAVRFSFILSIPAVLGACVLKLPEFFETSIGSGDLTVYLAGMAAAAISGVLAIGLVKLISKKSTFKYFSFYCIAAGCFAIIFGITKML